MVHLDPKLCIRFWTGSLWVIFGDGTATLSFSQPSGDEGNGVEGRTKPTKDNRALALRSKKRHTNQTLLLSSCLMVVYGRESCYLQNKLMNPTLTKQTNPTPLSKPQPTKAPVISPHPITSSYHARQTNTQKSHQKTETQSKRHNQSKNSSHHTLSLHQIRQV
jgi:hypothetical protein